MVPFALLPAALMSLDETFPVVGSFREQVIAVGLRPAQMALVAFLIAFGGVRLYTNAVRKGWGPWGNLSLSGVRVHHMVPGILLLLGSGFLAIAVDPNLPWWLWWLLPSAFGVGAALTLDEYALWIHLRDVYWAEEGRRSVDACIIAATLLAIVALGLPFWIDVLRDSAPEGFSAIISYHSVSLLAAIWAMSKGKWVSAVVSLVFWPVGVVAGIRLARPRSLWARRFYGPDKMARAWERFPEDRRRPHHPEEAGVPEKQPVG